MGVIVQQRRSRAFGLILTALMSVGILALPHGGPVVAAAPVAVDDIATTDADTPVVIAVRANDTDADGDTLTVTDINGLGTATPVAIDSGAVVIQIADGTLLYHPNGAFDPLAVGAEDIDSFEYTVSDGTGETATAVVAVTVSGVDDSPAANDSAITDEDTPILIDVLANDTASATAVTAIDGSPFTVGAPIALPSQAIVTVNLDATLSYDPNGSYDDLGPGESTTDTFEYTVNDDAGGPATATVTITVVGVNHAPTAVDDAISVDVNGSITIDVVANDSDLDGDQLTAALTGPPEHGAARCVASGECTYTPDAGYSGEDAFTYSIVDVVTPSQFARESTASVIIVVGTGNASTTVARPQLPATGDETGSVAMVAVVVSLLGLALVGVSRRRSLL